MIKQRRVAFGYAIGQYRRVPLDQLYTSPGQTGRRTCLYIHITTSSVRCVFEEINKYVSDQWGTYFMDVHKINT